MSTIRESMLELHRVTNGTYPQIAEIEQWCEERPPHAGSEYAAAAVELAKGGVSTDRILDSLEAIRQTQNEPWDEVGVLRAAEICAVGLAYFGDGPTVPMTALLLARRAIEISQRPR